MNRIKHLQFVLPVLLVLVAGTAYGSAHYSAGISGFMEIFSIGTESVFDSGSISTGVAGFTITVDPSFTDPTFQVTHTPAMMSGSGDFDAVAGASANLLAADPFNLMVGDAVSIGASAEGTARDTTDSSAASSAGVSATLHLVNNSDVEVVVDYLWGTSGRQITSFSGPAGESATTSVTLDPPIAGDLSGGTDPRSYRVAPRTTRAVTFVASASGSATAPAAIPEPASFAIWSLLALLAVAITRRRTRHDGPH